MSDVLPLGVGLLSSEQLGVLRDANFGGMVLERLDGLSEFFDGLGGGAAELWGLCRVVVFEAAFGLAPAQCAALANCSLGQVEGWLGCGEVVLRRLDGDVDPLRAVLEGPFGWRDKVCAAFVVVLGWARGLVQARLVGAVQDVALGRVESVDPGSGEVRAGFRPSWQASAWLLEHGFRDGDFGPVVRSAKVDVAVEGQVSVGVVEFGSVERALELLAERSGVLEAGRFGVGVPVDVGVLEAVSEPSEPSEPSVAGEDEG